METVIQIILILAPPEVHHLGMVLSLQAEAQVVAYPSSILLVELVVLPLAVPQT